MNRINYSYRSANVVNQISTIYKYLQKENRKIYKNSQYRLAFKNYNYTEQENWNNKVIISYKDIADINKNTEDSIAMRIISGHVKSIVNMTLGHNGTEYRKEEKEKFIKEINNIEYIAPIQYYDRMIEIIANNYKNIISYTSDVEVEAVKQYYQTVKETILENKFSVQKDEYNNFRYIYFDINKECDIQYILHFCERIFLDKARNKLHIGNLLDYDIDYLSGGEEAYLNIFATLDNRLKNSNQKNYIITLDEPESKMHPDMAREFIKSFMNFIEDMGYEDKKFQVIISTHSPFILSDIYSDNVIYLRKNRDYTKVSKDLNQKTFSNNIHKLLANSFFMEYTIGEYAKDKIIEIIDYLESDKEKDKTTLKQYKEIIENIGEPIIRKDLEEMISQYIK